MHIRSKSVFGAKIRPVVVHRPGLAAKKDDLTTFKVWISKEEVLYQKGGKNKNADQAIFAFKHIQTETFSTAYKWFLYLCENHSFAYAKHKGRSATQ